MNFAIASRFEQIIVAGGDEDISPADMLDWVHPVLAAIPDGGWQACDLDLDGRSARFTGGSLPPGKSLARMLTAAEARRLTALFPDAQGIAAMFLNQYAAQAVTLLDGNAKWLIQCDGGEKRLRPLLKLFDILSVPQIAAE